MYSIWCGRKNHIHGISDDTMWPCISMTELHAICIHPLSCPQDRQSPKTKKRGAHTTRTRSMDKGECFSQKPYQYTSYNLKIALTFEDIILNRRFMLHATYTLNITHYTYISYHMLAGKERIHHRSRLQGWAWHVPYQPRHRLSQWQIQKWRYWSSFHDMCICIYIYSI